MITMNFINLTIAGTIGACLGSFLNVAAHRSIINKSWWGSERSICESCGHVLGFFELIPVFSWLFLRGRCKNCGAKISIRYLLVELICAAMAVIIFYKYKISWACLLFAVGSCGLVLNSLTDFESGDVFDIFAIAPGVLALLIRIAGGWDAVWDGIEGAAIGWGIFAAIIFLSRGGMGWGDASFMGGTGAVLGVKLTSVSLYLGIMTGGIFAIIMILLGRFKWGRHDTMPLVPFLSIGCFIAMIFGPEIFDYLASKFYIISEFLALPWPFTVLP